MRDGPLAEWTVDAVLDAVAAREPVPGGGAVAALAGAGAAALIHMVAALARGRSNDPAAEAELVALCDKARHLQRRFQHLADDDVAAYQGVASALGLPRSTDDERARRAAALQQALARAAEVPLTTARLAVEALFLSAELAPRCPRAARSDLLTAVHLARAAAAAALANVDANALSLAESPLRRELARARSELGTAARTEAERLLAFLETALQSWLAPPDPPPSA